ncbi:MAG: PHP domain-containing protein [Candidatus Paceibacterota bacterium]|jgi:hypothetical protein|nr:PHP domain-containing protein [Candidatus Paceibacterota bacterium]MDD4830530.1 PHP domain-containing protein [Candidatus Paceibacterota bacterium]MDD4874801.1 PHP domain-containing protein [Candidatus Paceibacterota bacterium]
MKIDCHNHSYWSYDGLHSPEQLIVSALKKGMDGIALTDHDTAKGWPEAIEAAKKHNALLILGQEIKTDKGDVLGLFLSKEVKSRNLLEAAKEIKGQGGIAVAAHPFHFPEQFRGDLKKYAEIFDGIEVFNGRLPNVLADKKARKVAEENNLAFFGGSDAHLMQMSGNAYTEADAKTLEEFKRAIIEKKTRATGKKSSIFYLIAPVAAKTLRRLFADKRKNP